MTLKIGVPQIQIPFELGQCLGLLMSVRNMLATLGLDEDAAAFEKLSRVLLMQVNGTLPHICPNYIPYEVPT